MVRPYQFLVVAFILLFFVGLIVRIVNAESTPVGTVLSVIQIDNNCVIKTVKISSVESKAFMICENNTTALDPADSNESRELLLKSK